MKNDLRQSVDCAFAGATWDEAHARRVISRIEERKQPVMKRKLTVALVCALVLVLASACALAAVFVQRSERSNVVLTARNALTRQCRFTPGMLALFRADAQKNAGGDYTVTFMMVRFRASSMRVRRILLRIVQRSWARPR